MMILGFGEGAKQKYCVFALKFTVVTFKGKLLIIVCVHTNASRFICLLCVSESVTVS